ncbi:unnamed protein product, partial [marine sediment metagenome]
KKVATEPATTNLKSTHQTAKKELSINTDLFTLGKNNGFGT